MAKFNGSQFYLRKMVADVEAFIVCEQSSEFNVAVEEITVQCKTTGEWGEELAGGTKSGNVSFTGAYVKDPAINELSFGEVFPTLGEVSDYVWGGTEIGDLLISFTGKLLSLNVSASTNEAVTFTMELKISAEPIMEEVGT